jgi:hypothetical protein
MNVELRGSTSLFAGDFAALWWWQENFQRITALSSGPRVARIREAQGVQTAASMSIRRREIESQPAPEAGAYCGYTPAVSGTRRNIDGPHLHFFDLY